MRDLTEQVCALAYVRKGDQAKTANMPLENIGEAMQSVPFPLWSMDTVEPHDVVARMETGGPFVGEPLAMRAARAFLVTIAERPGVVCCAVCKQPLDRARKLDVLTVIHGVSPDLAIALGRCEACAGGSFPAFVLDRLNAGAV